MQQQPYNETYRPQFHFSPRRNWLNDPNGLVYYKGTWHLFYQYCPDLRGNGDKYWGYATSRDLVHWKEHEFAFGPDKDGAVWSGGGAVDWTNSTGFDKNGRSPLVAMYTASGVFTQCLVYSDDDGKTWRKYPQPVLGHIVGENRDPRPVWYKPRKSWVVALYLDGDEYAFFGSKDMKSWTELSRLHLSGSGECPELFEMPIDGSKGETRWVFYGGNFRYLIGSFDGRVFAPETGPIQSDFGNAFYASQTWSDAPNGRRVQIAWMPRGEPMPGMNFTGQMSFPCDLHLRRTADGLRLFRMPAREIEKLYGSVREWKNLPLKPGENPVHDLSAELLDVEAEIELGDASEVGVRVRGEEVAFHAKGGKVTCLGCEAPARASGSVKLRLLVDRTSLEVFAADGAVSLTSYFVPPANRGGLEVFAKGGPARIVRLVVRELKSAW